MIWEEEKSNFYNSKKEKKNDIRGRFGRGFYSAYDSSYNMTEINIIPSEVFTFCRFHDDVSTNSLKSFSPIRIFYNYVH